LLTSGLLRILLSTKKQLLLGDLIMRVEVVESLIGFGRTVGLACSIAGATIIIGSIFLNNPCQQATACQIGGLSLGGGLFLTGAAANRRAKFSSVKV
jgi:hypothetical protein